MVKLGGSLVNRGDQYKDQHIFEKFVIRPVKEIIKVPATFFNKMVGIENKENAYYYSRGYNTTGKGASFWTKLAIGIPFGILGIVAVFRNTPTESNIVLTPRFKEKLLVKSGL